MKKVSITTLNVFNQEVVITGYVKLEELESHSVMLFEEINDEDFFLIPQQQLINIQLN